MTYLVRVKGDYRWNNVRVAGRQFGKAPTPLHESELTDEIRNSPILFSLLNRRVCPSKVMNHQVKRQLFC